MTIMTMRKQHRGSGSRIRIPILPLATAIMLAVIIVGAMMVASATRQRAHLHDGTVWVTSMKRHAAMRFNVRVGEADATAAASSATFDVAQHGNDMLLVEDGTVSSLDAATTRTSGTTSIAGQSLVATASGTVAVLDQANGNVRVGIVSDLDSVGLSSEPDMALGYGGRIAMSHDGVVYGYRPSDGMVLAMGQDGVLALHESLSGGNACQVDDFTVIGTTPVIVTDGVIRWPSGTADTGVEGPMTLQSPDVDGEQGAWVAAAHRGGLFLTRLRPGDQQVIDLTTDGDAEPARPVSVAGCVYAAWSLPARNYRRVCDPNGGGGDGTTGDFRSLDAVAGSSHLLFRVNHRLVLLNDVMQGTVWEPEVSEQAVEVQWDSPSWSDADGHTDVATSVSRERDGSDMDCSDRSGTVRAVDDRADVRVGNTRVVDVLRNDEQTDCSIVRIVSFTALADSDKVMVSSIHNDRYLRVDASSATDRDAGDELRFSYSIDNGRGRVSSAFVTVTLIGADGNHPPASVGAPLEASVEQGGVWEGNVLGSFDDPDGDPLMLLSASVANENDAVVSTRPDGRLEFAAAAGVTGRVRVELSVYDGHDIGTGMLYVTVHEPDTLPAVVEPVTRSAVPNVTSMIDLSNHVRSVSAHPVTVSDVRTEHDATVMLSDQGLGFSFTASATGTYYVSFTVNQGSVSTDGLARIDVFADDEGESKPLIVDDTAILDDHGMAIVDPLANDVDPSGGALGLIRVHEQSESGLVTAVSGSRVHIRAIRMPSRPVAVVYEAENGGGTALGRIVVYPPPVRQSGILTAGDITLRVRAGGITSADVLDHVRYPSGTTVTVDHEPQLETNPFQGLLFVAGTTVRYQAGDDAGRFEATYTVRDRSGNSATGRITVFVHLKDAERKAKPTALPVRAQVAAGHTVRVMIPLTGIDEDGDDIVLSGLGNRSPTMGRIIEVGADYLSYEAYADSRGTDSFSYAVEDWTGQRAQAEVQVAILPADAVGSMMARDDEVTLRPDTRSSVQVTANDIATDGTDLTVQELVDVRLVQDAGIVPEGVSFTTPSEACTAYIVYRISDGSGVSSTATLTIHVDDQAPIIPPTVADYRIPPADTIDKRSVTVDVSAFIANPSGLSHELTVTVAEPAANQARRLGDEDSTVIEIDLAQTARAIPYIVTNTTHGISSTAFIHAPAYGVFPPMLRPNAPALTVRSGETLTISLADHVRVGAGKTVSIASRDTVYATKAADTDLVIDDQTLRFSPQSGYSGPASITFLASDAAAGHTSRIVSTAMLTLPITVIGNGSSPPVFVSPVIEVASGEQSTIDLAAMVRDGVTTTVERRVGGMPNDAGAVDAGTAASAGRYTFTATACGSSSMRIAVETSGMMTVRVPDDTVPGTTCIVPVTIGYVEGTITGTVTVRAVASSRPLARVNNEDIVLHAGANATVDILRDAYDPFPDTPLSIVDCKVDAPASITVTECSGKRMVSVSTAAGTGPVAGSIRVSVQDATRRTERQVSALISVTVIDRPSTPVMLPVDSQPRNAMVSLAWVPGNANGSPIIEYQVQWEDGSLSCGTATNCQINNLTNGRRYSFTVRARNAVGWSDASAAVIGFPDAVPSAPEQVMVEAGYRTVAVSWDRPRYVGSAPDQYVVTLSDSTGRHHGTQTSTTTNSVFEISHDAIRDGISFTATVKAHNRAGTGPEGGSPGRARPWSDPDAPSVTVRQQDDAIVLDIALEDMRNAGCDHVTVGGYASRTLRCDETNVSLALRSDGDRPDPNPAHPDENDGDPGEPKTDNDGKSNTDGNDAPSNDAAKDKHNTSDTAISFTVTVHPKQEQAHTASHTISIVPVFSEASTTSGKQPSVPASSVLCSTASRSPTVTPCVARKERSCAIS